MSDLAATLWAAFAEESAEHLSAIEPLLVGLAGPPSAARQADVGALFRAFHSLKGLARAMSRHGMEAVAHQAESLLGLVRDHGATVDDDMLDALLEGLDGLRLQRDAAVARQDDEPPPAVLIARLQHAIAKASGAPPPDGPGKAPGGPVPDDEDHGSSGSDGADATMSTDTTGLGEDNEMLRLFAETLQVRLPELAGILSATEAQREELSDTIDSLVHGAGVMEMEALADLLREIGDEFTGRALPPDDAGRQAQRGRLRDLAERAALLEEMLEVEAGASALEAALRAAGELEGEAAFPSALAVALGELAVAVAGRDLSVAERARAAVQALAAARSAAPDTADLLALLGDICPRLASSALPATARLADLLAAVSEAGSRGTIDQEAGELASNLRVIVAAPASDGGDGDGDQPMTPAFRLDDPLVQALGSGQQLSLAGRLAAGEHAYGVTLFLEEAPVIASQLIGWLSGAGMLLTNRSVFMQNESWFEMLLASDLVPSALQAGLLEIDPDRTCLRELRELQATGDVPIALAQSAARTPNSPAPAPATPSAGTELRIPAATVERFMDAISDTRAGLADLEKLLRETEEPGAAKGRSIGNRTHGRQRELVQQVERIGGKLRLLHAAALEIRVVPIELALSRLPRVVHTLSREQGKEIDFVLEGREVRVDKAIVDRLIEPLLHMVRNGVDHGIETPDVREAAGKPRRARLVINVSRSASAVIVTITDDGRGLNRKRILARAVERGLVSADEASNLTADAVHRLILAPGFSTAAALTETSGRGVGMDVALTEVQRLGGELDIATTPGLGTWFTMRLPLTAAIQTAVLVQAADQILAVPERAIEAVAELARAELADMDGRPAYLLHGQPVPVLSLASLLWPDDPVAPASVRAQLVIINHEGELVALEVDQVLRRQELLLLRLHPVLAACAYVGGALVLSDGKVALLLDAEGLVAAGREISWQVPAQ